MTSSVPTVTSLVTDRDAFVESAAPTIQTLNRLAVQYGLEGRVVADHLCYKCADSETYLRLRAILEAKGMGYNHVAWIADRQISYVQLPRPIETLLGPIRFIELSDQKPDGSQVNGFDHVELYPAWNGRSIPTIEYIASRLEHSGLKVEPGSCPTHKTIDVERIDGLKLRLEAYALDWKIAYEEMKVPKPNHIILAA